MADETLPAEWLLDMAAKKLGYQDWSWVAGNLYPSNIGYIATIELARTLEALAKHDPSIVPVDEDLLIAREICARVVDEWEPIKEEVWLYRTGRFDQEPDVKFILSMLKRDPEALAAFRKEKGL